jgi:hypothetical protein
VEHRDKEAKVEVIPGEMREHDAKVGHHIAISPGAIPRFMKRFEERFSGSRVRETPGQIASHP